MALDKTKQVPLPEKKITRHKIKNAVYIYYTLRAYRNAAGKPTSDKVSIGKIDQGTGMLIPNRNYYEIYCQSEMPEVESVIPIPIFNAQSQRIFCHPAAAHSLDVALLRLRSRFLQDDKISRCFMRIKVFHWYKAQFPADQPDISEDRL